MRIFEDYAPCLLMLVCLSSSNTPFLCKYHCKAEEVSLSRDNHAANIADPIIFFPLFFKPLLLRSVASWKKLKKID